MKWFNNSKWLNNLLWNKEQEKEQEEKGGCLKTFFNLGVLAAVIIIIT